MSTTRNINNAAVAAVWWRKMTSDAQKDRGTRGPRRAALAELRRARDTHDVLQLPAALDLIQKLGISSPGREAERAAMLAGILASVREDDSSRPVARMIGRATLDDAASAKLSEARFRRLLQTEEDGLMDAMRRLVQQAGGRANVYDLAYAVLHWGDRVKKRWIFDYYNVFGDRETVSEPPQSTSGKSEI